MPSNVKAFLALSYLSVLIGVVYTILVFSRVAALTAQLGHGKAGGAGFVIGVMVVTDAILAMLISLAGFSAKNWARWTLLFLYVIGLFGNWSLFLSAERYPFEHIEQLVQMLLQAAAMFLIFSGGARDWFRRTVSS